MQPEFNADFKYACLLTLLVALMIYSAVSCSSPPGIVETPLQAIAAPTKLSPATDSSTPVLVSPSNTTTFPTATPTPLPLSPTPMPEIRNITGTLLIDSTAGRIYAGAEVDGQPGSIALSTIDGSPLAVYPYSGRLALDQNHHRLLVDQGQIGIVVLDSTTGSLLTRIELPVSEMAVADPQIDITRSIAYVFRKNTVYGINVTDETVTMSKTLSIPFKDCGQIQRDADITRSFYDPFSNTLYISFYTWECSAFMRDTLYVYDAATLKERGSLDTASFYQAAALKGSLYGIEQDAYLRIYSYWALSNDEIWFVKSVAGRTVIMRGIVVDPKRELLYEDVGEHAHQLDSNITAQIHISSAKTREILNTVDISASPLKNALLAGYDPSTDHLFFLDDGKLIVVPTTSILPVSPIKP